MKELINATKCTIICQLICWGAFILCDENKYMSQSSANSLASISGIIILLLLFVIYFIYSDKYIKNNNMNSLKFNILLFFTWSVLSWLIMWILLNLMSHGIFHPCQGSNLFSCLDRIVYIYEAFSMIGIAILILIIKVIILLYKSITKKRKK